MGIPVFGNGVTERTPVEGRFVRRQKWLQIVNDLLDDERQFQSREITLSDRCRPGFYLASSSLRS